MHNGHGTQLRTTDLGRVDPSVVKQVCGATECNHIMTRTEETTVGGGGAASRGGYGTVPLRKNPGAYSMEHMLNQSPGTELRSAAN